MPPVDDDDSEKTNVSQMGDVVRDLMSRAKRDRAYLIVLQGSNVGEMYRLEAGECARRGNSRKGNYGDAKPGPLASDAQSHGRLSASPQIVGSAQCSCNSDREAWRRRGRNTWTCTAAYEAIRALDSLKRCNHDLESESTGRDCSFRETVG